MASISNLNEVLLTQAIYMLILGLITYGVKKSGRKQGFLYWVTVSIDILYGLTFGWLFYEYSSFESNQDAGRIIAWSMYSAIIPGALVLTGLVSFFANSIHKRRI